VDICGPTISHCTTICYVLNRHGTALRAALLCRPRAFWTAFRIRSASSRGGEHGKQQTWGFMNGAVRVDVD
jgi:hypothetical protein